MIRPYTEDDFKYIYLALKNEGLTEEEMSFEDDQVFIMDIGFFSFKERDEYPELMHFCVDKDKRSMKSARQLLKAFRNIMLFKGYSFFIATAPKDKPYIKRLLEYLKGKYYTSGKTEDYYIVPLFGRISNVNL